MKKSLVVCIACFTISGLQAQVTTHGVPQPEQSIHVVPPPPPPEPPAPPVPSVDEIMDVPPAPPSPPAPPMAVVHPAPPTPPPPVRQGRNKKYKITPPPVQTVPTGPSAFDTRSINNSGFDISLAKASQNLMIVAKKNGKEQRIKLSTWNSDRKYYESRYGSLPAIFPGRQDS